MKPGVLFVVTAVLAFHLRLGGTLADEREPAELDVPYEPTHPEVVDAMLDVAGVSDQDVVYDLGCGDGRIVVRAAKKLGARGLGVDLDPQRVREARENAAHQGVERLVEFREADLLQTDLRPATVVTLYLLPSVNLVLRPKLMAELQPGTRVVSHAFTMGDWEADKTLEQPRARGHTVYFWVIPAAAGGTWRWQDLGPDSGPVTARLEQCFQRLSGQIRGERGAPLELQHGLLSGKEIIFAARIEKSPEPVKVLFRGVVDGDTIKGTQQWNDGSNIQERPWTAQRDPVDVAGVWQMTDCPEQVKGSLRIDRNAAGGLVASRTHADGTEDALPQFYAWGACLHFEAPHEGGTLACTGFINGDSAEGKVSGPGLTGPRSWSAKRAAAKPAQPAAQTGQTRGRQWTPQLGPPQPGDEYLNRRDGSLLVWVPGGAFTMGRDDGPEDERPAHRVVVDGFWLGKFEVTNHQFARFQKKNEGNTPMFWDNPDYNQPEQPVVGVTLSEARAYCDWAGLRLPTEAEWEYAASAGRGLRYPTVSGDIGPDLANIQGVSGTDRWEFTAPVGQFPPNQLGLCDLAGNAWEWTSSRCNAYPYCADDGREDDAGGLRVLRGGCWAFPGDYAATTRRHRFSAYLRYDYPGIRVACSKLDTEPHAVEAASTQR